MRSRNKKRVQGRGLSELLEEIDGTASIAGLGEPGAAGRRERAVPIEAIHPNADQPRKDFDERQIAELADSIRRKGVIQPLIVRERPGKPGEYQIVAGERRWRAAQAAKVHELPVIVRDYTDAEVLEIAIVENIQRAELNALEEAAGYRQLMDRFGHTQEQVSKALGKSRSHVANLLRLLNLPDDVQEHVRRGRLSAGHARALVTADDPSGLAAEVVRGGLSVREAERRAKSPAPANGKAPGKAPARGRAAKDPDTAALESDLSAAVGLKVRVDHAASGESGKLVIGYRTLDDLDRLCAILSAPR